DVSEPVELRLDRGVHLVVRVAHRHREDAAEEVEVLAAVDVAQPQALALGEHDRLVVVVRHGGEQKLLVPGAYVRRARLRGHGIRVHGNGPPFRSRLRSPTGRWLQGDRKCRSATDRGADFPLTIGHLRGCGETPARRNPYRNAAPQWHNALAHGPAERGPEGSGAELHSS